MNGKRWTYVVAGVIMLLGAGLVYAWSVLSSPVAAYFPDWTKAQLSLTFTICMAFFCIGGFLGGLLSGKINVKINVWVSAILFMAGFAIASRAGSPAALYVGYGVMCGFASGLVYNAVMSTVLSWFPDQQGLVSGVLLMGFGMSSFLVGKIYQAVTPSGAGMENWRSSFFIMGIILMVILAAGSFLLAKPGEKDRPALEAMKQKAAVGGSSAKSGSAYEATPAQMLGKVSFWLYFVWAILLSASGLALISQASGVAMEVGTGISPGTIATAVGMISICNGIGRLILGGLFDKLGRGVTMTIITVGFLLAAVVMIMALKQTSFVMMVLGFVATGFVYGGITSTNSAFISSFYGSRNYPVNFSIINMNLLISSFGGTIAGVLYDKSGSYMSTFMLMIGAAAVAMVCSILIRRPQA